jgi:RNA polymerase sigma-70 factor (ECF subfamily)
MAAVNRLPPEADLVKRARNGDASAYADVVRAHEQIAFRTAVLICGNVADAEEAAQDAFVKAHGALGRFRPGEPFRPWLLAIVANEARNRRRAAGRRAAMPLRLFSQHDASEPGSHASPETVMLADERRTGLLAAIAALRPEDRLVIGCRYLLELSEAETAAALGVRPGTVKSRLSRALERLRGELENDG